MKSKDKTRKNKKIHIKLSIKNLVYLFAFITIVIYAIIFYNFYFTKEVFATEVEQEANNEEFKVSNAESVNIDEIILQNTNEGKREEYSVHEEDLEYITKYRTNANLPKGMVQVVQEGREGKQEVTTKTTYKDDEVVSEEQVNSKVTKASINKIVEIGGGRQASNYKVKNGDTLYVTSDRLSVMVEPNEESQKVATLSKGDELKLLEIDNQWYKIISGTARGYVKAECTTYLNPNQKEQENTENSSTQGGSTTSGNSNSIQKLSFGMALNKPSGLSLEQFTKVLTDSKDVNKIFENNAQYFYYIEKQYNINGLFVASVAIHESGWGTSKISQQKKNLFGYGAYDSSPYNSAYTFSDYSESIDLLARVFVKYYLNPKGTEIYGGEKATGSYYNGPTLTGVNTKYATDKNWANKVYETMKYLYNKL